MKLARPDVFHPRIVLAGCPRHPGGDGDDDGLVGALRRRGLFARWLSWDDPEAVRADVVILRATWDYAERLDEFLAWTKTVRHLLNPPAVVAWNSDKRYLLDLARRGVPTVPAVVFGPAEDVRPPAATEVVVEPSVYDPRAESVETALVFLGGKASHAFTKAAVPPPGTPESDAAGSHAPESLTPSEPDFEVWDVGFDALRAAAAAVGMAPSELLCARADVIGGVDGPRLLELKLIEPSLGWHQLDTDTRERQLREFALAVESALERLGLGPLSHRRP